MFFANLTLAQFLGVFSAAGGLTFAIYLFSRSRRKQVVSTLRFWIASEKPPPVQHRRIQEPISLLLQILSTLLLVLAMAQLQFGSRANSARRHVLLLDNSAWMAAVRPGASANLMELARRRALSWVHALPSTDHVMVVRADSLVTPVTGFESDRRVIERAIGETSPSGTALQIQDALEFAKRAQGGDAKSNYSNGGEIVFVGAGRISSRQELVAYESKAGDDSKVQSGEARPASLQRGGDAAALPSNLRVLRIADEFPNYGIRRLHAGRAAGDPQVWNIEVAAHNYATTPARVNLALNFNGLPVGADSSVVGAGQDWEPRFAYRSGSTGVLEARIARGGGRPGEPAGDALAADDVASLRLPAPQPLQVLVYSQEPELLKPFFDGEGLRVSYLKPSEYRPPERGSLVVFDRFRPSNLPPNNGILIDPPKGQSPVPVDQRADRPQVVQWTRQTELGSGLRATDFRPAASSVFLRAPGDILIAEAAAGPLIVARESNSAAGQRLVVFGFQPGAAETRYQLAMPILFANILRWMAPGTFKLQDFRAESPGSVSVDLGAETPETEISVVNGDGNAIPFTVHGQILRFFAEFGSATVKQKNREMYFSLTLPELWDHKWEVPATVAKGIPKFREFTASIFETWRLLAMLGVAGLLFEYFQYGRAQHRKVHQTGRPIPFPSWRPAFWRSALGKLRKAS